MDEFVQCLRLCFCVRACFGVACLALCNLRLRGLSGFASYAFGGGFGGERRLLKTSNKSEILTLFGLADALREVQLLIDEFYYLVFNTK